MNETLKDFLRDGSTTFPLEKMENREIENIVGGVLAKLPKREKEIVLQYYGFDGGDGKTLEEIGTDFGLSRERIRQIKSKALRKLRRNKALREIRIHVFCAV